MVLHDGQQVVAGSARGKFRQFAARALLVFALLGGSLGLFLHPQPVAAAGWNHFIDPTCPYSGRGQATPGINWWGWAPTSFGSAYSDLFFDAGAGYNLVDQNPGYQQVGASGDVRNIVGSTSGFGNYRGVVNYATTWAGDGRYSETFWCS